MESGIGLNKAKPTLSSQPMDVSQEMQALKEEINSAKQDWDNALRHFEYALGKDQIDYAIFSIEAAEKRYEMLLRKAKALNVQWPKWQGGEVK